MMARRELRGQDVIDICIRIAIGITTRTEQMQVAASAVTDASG